ncbi:plasmid mobilization protein [Streptomyces sp. MS19]|uniref:plasmid mobilization protein n=1 Tax=Streptomyces sp. MS19 TaxID=3385972 RepID=UPI0039A3DC27
MNDNPPPARPTRPAPSPNSVAGRASYPFGYSTTGGVSKGSAAPAGAGVRRRGAPDEEAATEGGSQPGTAGPQPGEGDGRRRSRRRRYQNRRRPHVRNTRLTDDELARVTAGANAAGLTVAGFLARSALGAARDLNRTTAALADHRDVVAELFAARRHLGHIGNNLNQLTRAVNSGARPPQPQLDAVLTATQRAVLRVQTATDRLLDQT